MNAGPRIDHDESEMGRNLMDRHEVRARLHAELARGRALLGVGAGSGISAKFAERGGADLILVYNSGKFRMDGLSSNAGLLALGDANQIVMEMGTRAVLPAVDNTPVVAGVNGTDATRLMPQFLRGVQAAGFSGVINFPSHGIIDGRWRQSLEETGFGYNREIAMLRCASELGLFCMAYVFDPDEATAMAEAGVDVVVAHMGLTAGGDIGAKSTAPSLDDAAERISAIAEAATHARAEIIVLCHGGPLSAPKDVAYVLERSTAQGFVGASSYERLAIEDPLQATVEEFKAIDALASAPPGNGSELDECQALKE